MERSVRSLGSLQSLSDDADIHYLYLSARLETQQETGNIVIVILYRIQISSTDLIKTTSRYKHQTLIIAPHSGLVRYRCKSS